VKSDESDQQFSLRNSNLYRNGSAVRMRGNENISVDPRFVAPYKMSFRLQPGSECLRSASDGTELGARIASSH
jgi:hypothetical protein